jgi:homoserine kinase
MGSVPQTAHRSLAEVLAMRRLPGLLGLALCGSGPSVTALATAGFDEIGKAIAACFEHAE